MDSQDMSGNYVASNDMFATFGHLDAGRCEMFGLLVQIRFGKRTARCIVEEIACGTSGNKITVI